MSRTTPIIKKIPGEVIPSKKSSQGYIDDLHKKQKFELLDLLERQEKLLANKSFISKLPDKGEKILNFKQKILKELEYHNHIENAANTFSKLNIASEGESAMTELEWTGKYTEHSKHNVEKIIELASDDEDDPLKILAQPTGSGAHEKKIIHLAPEESLIKPEDLEEIESFKTLDPLELEHVKYIVNKVENKDNERKKEPFKPHKTTKTNVHDPEKEKGRKSKSKHWENTAATPPLIINGAVKSLDLNESLKLQQEQALKLQEIQAKNAAERLTQQLGMHKLEGLPNKVGNYRTHNDEDSNSSSSEDENYPEVYDEDDDDKRGTVVFTVDSIHS